MARLAFPRGMGSISHGRGGLVPQVAAYVPGSGSLLPRVALVTLAVILLFLYSSSFERVRPKLMRDRVLRSRTILPSFSLSLYSTDVISTSSTNESKA
jgi:hypothetical protein